MNTQKHTSCYYPHLGLKFTASNGVVVESWQLLNALGYAIATLDLEDGTITRFLAIASAPEAACEYLLRARDAYPDELKPLVA